MNELKETGYLLTNLNDFLECRRAAECRVKSSWNNLEVDRYLPPETQYRYRRYSRFIIHSETAELDFASSIYTQTEEYNSLFGGVNRIFAPIELDDVFHDFIKPLTFYDQNVFGNSGSLGVNDLSVGIHQIRTIARTNSLGLVTPEGLHKDGHKLFVIHLIDRKNIAGGNTKIYDNKLNLKTNMILEDFMDSLFVEDAKIYHEVTPISVLDQNEEGHRDVLIIEFY